MSERPVKRRRRRSRGKQRSGEVTFHQQEGLRPALAKQSRPLPEWNWRTFPVFFAFVLGVVVMGVAVASPILSAGLFFAGLFGLAYGLAHLATRMIVAWRQR